VSHLCHAYACTKEIPPKILMCLKHWRLVDQKIQAMVWKTYVPGQEIRKDPTRAYLLAQRSAVWCVFVEEGGCAWPDVPEVGSDAFMIGPAVMDRLKHINTEFDPKVSKTGKVDPMKAITVKQPWASLIIRGGKEIENRDWYTGIRGIVAVHSSAKLERREMEDACGMMRGFVPHFSAERFELDVFPTGVILGTVEIVDCVTASDSPWFVGDFGWVLRNPVAFAQPIPCRGALKFWDIPEHLLEGMREQWRLAKAAKS
jgi:hypothetical protein